MRIGFLIAIDGRRIEFAQRHGFRAVGRCFPGLGDTDCAAIIKELRRGGYRDPSRPGGPNLEDTRLLIAKQHLSQYVE